MFLPRKEEIEGRRECDTWRKISDARKGGFTQAKAYILEEHLSSEKRKSLISSQDVHR